MENKDGRPGGLSSLRDEAASASSPEASIPDAVPDAADLSGFKWPLMGYAPGGYFGKCYSCKKQFHGLSKRSSSCLKCALEIALTNSLEYERALRIKLWNEAKAGGISDRASMEHVSKGIDAAHAKAIEARQGGGADAVHESAVSEADLPEE